MKITPEPVKLVNHPTLPAIGLLLSVSKAPREVVTQKAYQQLVTLQGVDPDRAKELLGLKKVVAP